MPKNKKLPNKKSKKTGDLLLGNKFFHVNHSYFSILYLDLYAWFFGPVPGFWFLVLSTGKLYLF